MSSNHPRIIVALDFPTKSEAIELVEKLDPAHCHLKIGMTMFTRYGPEFVENLMHRGYAIFLDLKFHDIPHQVGGACRSAADLGVWMLTIHTMGGAEMCESAANAMASYTKKPLLIGVTILTSANQNNLTTIGVDQSIDQCVVNLATLAQSSGLDGVVCSPWEVPLLKQSLKGDLLLVTPGIRLEAEDGGDQKRIMTPDKAIAAGSDYLVMGRSIIHSDDPLKMIKAL